MSMPVYVAVLCVFTHVVMCHQLGTIHAHDNDTTANDLRSILSRDKMVSIGSNVTDGNKAVSGSLRSGVDSPENATQITSEKEEEHNVSQSSDSPEFTTEALMGDVRSVEEQEEFIRAEIIKQQVLNRLGIANISTEPQRAYAYDELPGNLRHHFQYRATDNYNQDFSDEPIEAFLSDYQLAADSVPRRTPEPWQPKHFDDADKTQEVIIFGKEVSEQCLVASQSVTSAVHCLIFNISRRLTDERQIKAGRLWLAPVQVASAGSKQQRTISLYDTKVDMPQPNMTVYREGKQLDQQRLNRFKSVWLSFDMSLTLSSWQRSGGQRVLQVQCKTCSSAPFLRLTAPYEPYIVFKLGKSLRSRNKRHVIECSQYHKHCCVKKLYVSFASWARRIVQPEGFWANYCTGECQGLHLPATKHSVLMTYQQAMRQQNDVEIPSCCAPTKFSPLSVLYWNDDGDMIKRDLQNMAVEKCECK